MRKTRKRCAPLLTCGLFCALLLSGCSSMMQSVADGTDAVLNGLAEGTDQIAGALADMTDAALDAAADATDDSVKDAILDRSLQGERVRGEDDYTGTYAADYEDFSGTELLFGGTTLNREAGNTVELTCSLDIEEGEAAIFLCSGVRERGLLRHHRGGQRKRLSRCLGRGRDRERVHSNRVNCEVRHADTEKTTGADYSADRSRRDFVRQCGGCSGIPDVS